jgi:hypothetical protein
MQSSFTVFVHCCGGIIPEGVCSHLEMTRDLPDNKRQPLYYRIKIWKTPSL